MRASEMAHGTDRIGVKHASAQKSARTRGCHEWWPTQRWPAPAGWRAGRYPVAVGAPAGQCSVSAVPAADGGAGWSFASAREPARFAAAEESDPPQAEHAFQPPATLCGIPEARVVLYRHLFKPASPRACPRCREEAAAAPPLPSAQERLHDKALTAPPGPLQGLLLDALRSGARIIIWVNGPGTVVARHARVAAITDGAAAVEHLLASRDPVGIARVAQASGEFIVVLPQHADPIIAFAAGQAPPSDRNLSLPVR